MLIRKALIIAFVLATVGLALSPTITGADTVAHTNYITFSKPVRLPGTVLGSGTYIFEMADPMGAWGVVSVKSRDRRRVYYTGHTLAIPRPNGLPGNQVVSLGEARPDVAAPIRVWWPIGEAYGREFSYRNR